MQPLVEELEAFGRILYGQHWQRPTADALNLDPRTIRYWLSGQGGPTREHVRVLGRLVDEQMAKWAEIRAFYGD
jgi:hypothetical protein